MRSRRHATTVAFLVAVSTILTHMHDVKYGEQEGR